MKNVLILGCGRSGTSIFGELFENNPFYSYLFEPSVDDVIKAKSTRLKRVAAKVPKSDSLEQSAGLSFDIERFHKENGHNYKYIFIVRHPLDTICSLKPGISKNWSHNPKPPGHKKMEKSLSLAECCAEHWNYINSIGLNSLREVVGVRNILIVKYENFVGNTEVEASRIYKFLGVPKMVLRTNQQKRYLAKVQNKTKGSYHAKKQVVWYKDDHSKRVQRWKKDLSQKEISACTKIVSNTSESFNYKLS